MPSCVLWWRLVLLQPLRCPTVDYLFPEPHQADKCTQGAGDDKAALQAVRQQVLSAGRTESSACVQRKERQRARKRCVSHSRGEHVQRQCQERAHRAGKKTLVDTTWEQTKLVKVRLSFAAVVLQRGRWRSHAVRGTTPSHANATSV